MLSILKKIKSNSPQKSRSKLIKKLDKVVSDLVRMRDGWRCQRCNKRYDPPTSTLHCSHYYSRRFMGTRWDLYNLDAMCYGCHRYIEGDKQGWYKDFKYKQLGKEQFDRMEFRAYGVTKYSVSDLEIMLKIFTEQYNQEKG